LEEEIDEKFSQSWQVYRIAMHDKGGLDIAADMNWKYSTKQLYNMLEQLDVYDSLNKQAIDSREKNKK
jgi:hypothetical protein